ncbi:hypothetical protein [Streptosporangium saharense]|uniref:hypothetical protein n=1 Tax=Streptosporangium saharense TaxID=1706840 RepID=UPI003327BE7E
MGVLSRRFRHGHGQDRDSGVFNRVNRGVPRYVITYRRGMRPRVLAKDGVSITGSPAVSPGAR